MDMPPVDVLAHIIDVHCHPTDSQIPQSSMASLPVKVCAMATKGDDQSLVRNLAYSWPHKVIPCFGYHPWFSHWISLVPVESKEQHYRTLLLDTSQPLTDEMRKAFEEVLLDLPQPVLLSKILESLRSDLTDFPYAMLGEVGVDRAFRIPFSQSLGGRHKLSDFTVPLAHQMRILESQIDLAVELRRNISLHSVKSQQITLELMDHMSKKHGEAWDMISVDIHSCGLSPEMWIALEKSHPNVYLSLSTAINVRSPSCKDLIVACRPDRILAESDFHDIQGVVERTWEMYKIIAAVKGWCVEEHWNLAEEESGWGVVRRLEENWTAFSRGEHVKERKELEAKKRSRKEGKDTLWDSVKKNEDF